MRKLCACFLIVNLFYVLSGCGSAALRAVPPPIPDSFSCSVCITTAEETIEGDWIMTHGSSVITLRAPAELAGMRVEISGDSAQISLDGVTAALTTPSCFLTLTDAYRRLLAEAPTGVQTQQGWLYDSRAAHGSAVLQDAVTGLPLRISVPAQQITAAFSAMRVTETETAA